MYYLSELSKEIQPSEPEKYSSTDAMDAGKMLFVLYSLLLSNNFILLATEQPWLVLV